MMMKETQPRNKCIIFCQKNHLLAGVGDREWFGLEHVSRIHIGDGCTVHTYPYQHLAGRRWRGRSPGQWGRRTRGHGASGQGYGGGWGHGSDLHGVVVLEIESDE